MSNYPPDAYPPDANPPERAFPDPYGSSREAASGKAVPAGICLFIVGLVNLLLPGFLLVTAVNIARISPEKAAEMQAEQIRLLRQMMPSIADEMEKKQAPPEESLRQAMMYYFVWGAVTGLGCLLTMIGGWRMWSLRNYGLAVTGAIVAAIPCVSCAGCCGIGEGIGIWALVVLLNTDVRAAFR
jgi:hypothetical protein